MKDIIKKKIAEFEKDLIRLRRHFHRYPELGLQEFETSAMVADLLKQWGIQVQEKVAGTGVVGIIRGGKPGRTIALRADMDALPIQEKTGLKYSSKHDGVMHACGHDGHTAILLATAKVLSELKENLAGNVKLIFQPAEEGPGGAMRMIEAGVLENPKVDVIAGLHIWPEIAAGDVGVTSGPVMAAMGRFDVTIKGMGGHGAMPHKSVDPIVAASHAVGALQTITSREVDPQESAVVSVCSFNAGTAFNVIPGEASLTGTVRTFIPELRDKVPARVEQIISGITTSLGCTSEFSYKDFHPATINDERFTPFVRKVAEDVVGIDHVDEIPRLSMGGEDFSFYQEKVPGTFFFLGTNNPEKGITQSIHHPEFDFDEDILARGAEIFCNLASRYLGL